MAFDRLQKLGEGKFQKVTNELARGTPAMAMARIIQQEWHDFQDVAEKTLTQQLNRLRLAMLAGQLGDENQKAVQSIAREVPDDLPQTPKGQMLVLGTYSCADKLTRLCLLAEERLERFIEKEKTMPMPIPGMGDILRDYAEFLLKLQKVRFDLGVDEFHGPTSSVRAGSVTTTNPDGSSTQKQVYEAIGVADRIFDRHGIEA